MLASCTSEPLDLNQVSERFQGRSGYTLEEKTDPERLSLPPGIDLAAGVDENDAVRLALWNNAAFQETLTDLGFAQADLLLAEIPPNPHFSSFFPIGPKQLEFTIRYPLETLWLRPQRIDLAELELDRVAESLVQNGLDLIRDVKIAMADLRLARRRAEIASKSADVLAKQAELSRAQFRAGDLSELDVATFANNALIAREEADLLDYEITLAMERLRLLTGLSFTAVKFLEPESYEAPPLFRNPDQLVADALASRPDLRAVEIQIEAAGKNLGIAKQEIYRLTGIIDSNSRGSMNRFEIGPGAEFPIPIFDRNQAGIARAEAQLKRAARRYATLRNQIALEVRQAFARYQQASQGLDAWRLMTLGPLQITLDQANKAYAAGETSLFPVLDATWNLFNVERREAEAVAGLQRAVAELERSLGNRLDLTPLQKSGAIPP